MSRSVRVAKEDIEKVKLALKRNGFPTQQSLADEVGVSLSTAKSFLNGNPVDYLNFVELSQRLGFYWKDIASLPDAETQQPASNPPKNHASPFITGMPIDQPRYFFGRERELKRIFNLLNCHPLQNAAIIGKRRSGKTSLLNYLKNITTTPPEQLRPNQKSNWLTHPQDYCWIFVDFQDPRRQSREALLRYILECLRLSVPNPCDLDNFMDVVSSNLHKPTVILLDEVGVGLQRCPELDDCFWEGLRALAPQTGGNLAFVLATPESPLELAQNTGHSSPFFNIFGYTTILGTLSDAEARELISSSPIAFADEDVEWILHESGRWPLLLQILCRERLFTLEERETGDDWQQEGLQQIKQFCYLLN
jgi:hypothetical protein